MNTDQLTGVLRIVVPAVLAWAVSRGWLTGNGVSAFTDLTINAIVALITLGAAVWSVHRNSDASQIARVARLGSVQKVLMRGRPRSK